MDTRGDATTKEIQYFEIKTLQNLLSVVCLYKYFTGQKVSEYSSLSGNQLYGRRPPKSVRVDLGCGLG